MKKPEPNSHPLDWLVDLPVDVAFDEMRLPGKVTQVHHRADGRDIKVVFDDPLVYGGVGAGWFTAEQVFKKAPSNG